MRPLLPALVDEIIEAVGSIPAYQRPLEGDFGIGVRAGVVQALNHWCSRSRPRGQFHARTSTGAWGEARCVPVGASTRC